MEMLRRNDPVVKSVESVLRLEGSLKICELEIGANAQRDGHPAEHRWRPLFNAAKFG